MPWIGARHRTQVHPASRFRLAEHPGPCRVNLTKPRPVLAPESRIRGRPKEISTMTLPRTFAARAAVGLAFGAASFAPPAAAREYVEVVRRAPPPPRFERVP